jgi:hypothetical protein
MTKSRLEKVLEFMVNGENELASEMLHEHLIETAREIYADLAEEDEAVEEELELDEDEDLEEGFHDEDESGDFVDDLETMENELETEEYFGEEEDEEDEAMDDLEGEMDMDIDAEMDDDMMGDADMGGDADVEDAMVNVEDAMAELRAAFADLMGDDMGDEGMDDEVADEFDGMDFDDEGDDDLEDDELGEAATLHKHAVTMKGDEDGKASPVKQNQPNISNHGKAVKFAGGDKKGGKGDSAKKMTVTGPQEQKGKMDKKVSAPSNSSEKAKSLFSDKSKH